MSERPTFRNLTPLLGISQEDVDDGAGTVHGYEDPSCSNAYIVPGRYWNCNGSMVAIIAVTHVVNGKLFDWAAYVGHHEGYYQHETEVWVARHGEKVDVLLAEFLFPVLYEKVSFRP